ncbi:MAG: hypothetical protein AAGC70_12335 [Pseudomonadota bacterium]
MTVRAAAVASGTIAGLNWEIWCPDTQFAASRLDLAHSLVAGHHETSDPFAHIVDAVLARIDQSLRADQFEADDDAARRLIADLEVHTRQIAFFGSGLSSLSNQAAAQFQGWNIPGVGEGAQRLRPRTRIYDTCDPDTLRQVGETLDFSRTGLIFMADAYRDTSLQQARTLLPVAQAAIGRDGLAQRLACVHGASGAMHHPELADLIEASGGKVLTLKDAAETFSVHGLLVGMSRGLDLMSVRAGACAVVAALHDPVRPVLVWPALMSPVLAQSTANDDRIIIPVADRLARFSAWACARWNIAQDASSEVRAKEDSGAAPSRMTVSPQSMCGQDPAGLGLHVGGSALVDLHGVAPTRPLAGDLAAHGHFVRQLSLSSYDAHAYGALMALMEVEAGLSLRYRSRQALAT